MKELSKKKYVTLITIMILVLGIIGIVNIGNTDLDKGKVKLKSASIEKLKSSVIESKGYEEITYPVLYELEKVEGIEERNVIIKGTLTKEENKYARFKEITSKTITSTVSENGREIEIRIEKVKLGRQNKINIKIEINGAINETKIKPEIEIKEESEKEYTKVNTEEIEVKTNSVTGLVQDEEGMSVSNLELSINKGNEEIRRTYTDENGRYVFSDVEEGKYTIKVEEENYELKEIKEVEVIGGITENIIVKKIKPYEIEVKKYISKIKLNNNGKEIEYEYGKLNKVNQTVKNLKNLSGEIEYKIEIKNTGEKSGEITKIEEEVTEGLSFKKEKNSEWEEKNGKIINRSLEGIKLKAGEEKEITLKLDIEKTDEARSYLQKVTAKGEVYQNVVYILGGKEYRKEKVLEGEKIEEPKIVQENFKGWYTDKKYTNKYNFNNDVTKDIILYGKVEESTKKYIVQYIDEGKIIKEEELEEGSIVNAPEVTKEGHTFIGWYEGEEKYDVYEPITRNLILESKYEINKYKVRFINEDGSVLQEETLDYGSTPTYKKETPTKKRTEEYTYEFDKWMPEITKVTGNQEYKATYKETKNKYTVTYINEGKEYHKETALYGNTIKNVENPTKEGYTFIGWYDINDKKVNHPITVTKNMTLYSKYEINSYKISYYNEGVKYIEDQKINYGENALKPNTNPSKIGYTFKYWSLKENGEKYEFSTKITKDISLYAVYEINKYTVTYINEGVEYHKETAEYGSVITSIQNPTKEGYTFTGWYTKGNEKVSYPITVTENITLYSKYEINSYKVSYYNEGKKYIDDQKINYGENALKPNTDPSKIGYTFKYWSIKENGEEYEFSTKITKDITLYAVYEINKYTVTYINEGTEYHKETAEYGSVVTSIQNPTKEGYTFIGWYNENNEKVTHPITVTENITLHSKYEINTYTVIFYHNNEKYVEDQRVNYGESAVKPSIDPTKEDYNFSGWVIKGTNNKYDFTSKVTKDIELESSFTAKPTYTVTFKIGNEVILTENVIEGHKVTSKEAPYKKGYLFDKWYSDEGLTIENNFDEKIIGNKTIYGKYNENKHTVTYINEGTTYYTEEVLDNFTATGPSENPSKEGYTFKYFSKDKKVAFDYNSEITEDTTLYAVYEINKYTVTYINEGSEYHKEELTYGSKHEKIEDPFKTGYTFIGWYNENEEKVEYPITVTKDITLHSKYEINKYTVTYMNEGTKYIEDQQINYREKAVKPETNPSKIGYTFKYWSVKENGEEYNFNSEITEDITLYAVYEINKYTVTYINEGSEYHKEELTYGSKHEKIEDPFKTGYTFIGWYNENEEKVEYPITVTKDITLHSKYEINKYTVTFNDEDRITTKEVNYNAKVEPVTNQGKTGYTFKYWSKEKGGEEYNFNSEITENITLYAIYNINKYTVTFKNYDGSTLQEETLEYGTIPVYKGEIPTREKTDEYTYTFKNWNKEITEVTDNEIYIAVYKEEKNKYTVIYMDGEKEYTRKEVNYGETVSGEVISKDHNIYRGWTLDGNVYDFNTPVTKNITIKSSFELVESPIIESTPIEWTKENVKVTITTNHNDYSYMYKIDDGEYQKYNGEFTVDKNCTVIAKSIKENVESEVTTKEITNIDKVLPEIKEIIEENITTKSFDIKVKGQDNESGLSEIRIYKNEELMVSYPYTERLNEEKEETYSLTGLEENTTYKIKVELIDKVGNINVSEEKEITTLKRVIVSRIIGRNNSLYESEAEYELFESLEEAVTSCGSNECTIEMVLDTKESVNVLEGQEIKLELNGKTVTGVRDYTIENSGELIIVDKEDSEGGIINNTDTAIKNIGNGILQIGENEEPLSVSMTKPNIVGITYGIYTEEETSKLKFYDGKIEGNVAIQGNVDDTPYLYNAKITNEGHQVATLSILAEAEAKITGGKYYTKLSNAVSETKSGTYEESNKSILSTAKSTTQYKFDYNEEENTLTSNNTKIQSASAYSYIELDLTKYTEKQELTVTGILSTYQNYGYAIVTDSKTTPTYNQTDGRILYMTASNSTITETGKIILEPGKVYYLHIGYAKPYSYATYDNNTDTFKITNITLNDYKPVDLNINYETDLVTPGTYGFVYQDGKLVSNNANQYGTTANSYIKVDLTNYLEDQKIYIYAELSADSSNVGWVTVTDNTSIPGSYQTDGRVIYLSGVAISKEYEATLTAGKINYIHLGYSKYKNYVWNGQTDSFTITGIYSSINRSESKNPTSKVPVLNQKVDTVQIVKDITLSSPIEINETKEMLLDLNGYTLTTTANDYVIKNNGDLTIIDGKYQKDIEKNQADYEAEQAKYDQKYENDSEEYNKAKIEYEKSLEEYNKKLEEYYANHPGEEYEYTGEEETYVVPQDGTYELETWGAQGGTVVDSCDGGYGGYSYGQVELKKGDILYINVGGVGTCNVSSSSKGGYNGGGDALSINGYKMCSGGGATHIATKSGLLQSLSDSIDSILIASGSGGGSGSTGSSCNSKGGSGGGISGTVPANNCSDCGTRSGGTQTSGGRSRFGTGGFGYGAGSTSSYSVGGGAGFYGGAGDTYEWGATGGSGYIGNSKLTSKKMYCYDCTESSDESTKTISTTNVSETPTENTAKIGNGSAKITLLGSNSSDSTIEKPTKPEKPEILKSNDVELETSNFTYSGNGRFTKGSSNLNFYVNNSGNKSVTYYNKKINVTSKTYAHVNLSLYQNYYSDGGLLGTAYIGFSKTNEANIDDFVSYVERDITSYNSKATPEDIDIPIEESGEYYFKIVLYHNNTYNYTVYSDLYSLSFDHKPTLKKATLKEATYTGTIESTTNSLIYNNLNANLTIKEAILNLNKSGSAIVNDGTVSTLSNVSINLNASGNGIYNGYYADIKDGGATINASVGSYGIYNLSKIDDGFNDYTFNLKYDSYHPSYGIYNAGKEINVKNITVNDGYVYNAKNSKINFENSKIKSRINSSGSIIKFVDSKINTYDRIYVGNDEQLTFNNSIIYSSIYMSGAKLKLENSELDGSIEASGEIYLKDSTVNGSIYGGFYSKNGKVTIDNSNVTASGNSCDNYMINMFDVTIKGKSVLTSTGFSSIYANSVTIGEKDGNINSKYPKIDNKVSSSNCIGILSENLKIYDGSITASKDNSIKSGISDIEDGYEIDIIDSVDDKNNNLETVSLVKPTEAVAQIGEKTYTTLSSAIDDVNNGETIQIVKNIFPVREFTISEDKDFTLDLNSYTIRAFNDEYLFSNSGTININDTSESSTDNNGITTYKGKIIVGSAGFMENSGNIALKCGTVTSDLSINNIIINSGDLTVDNIHIEFGETSSNFIKNSGTLMINNGSFIANKAAGSVITNDSNGEMTIKAGYYKLTSSDWKWKYLISNSGKANIYGGTIDIWADDTTGNPYNSGSYLYNAKGAIAKIENLKITSRPIYSIYNLGTVDVTNSILTSRTINTGTGIMNLTNTTVKNLSNSFREVTNSESGEINIDGGEYNVPVNNSSTGTINIKSGIFNNNISNTNTGIINNEDGTFNGTISNTNTGTINIKKGTYKKGVTSTGNGIINIGIKGDTDDSGELNVSKDNPNITNDTYGLTITNGKVNFYDGIISGTTDAVKGTINEIEDGYEIISDTTEDGKKSKYLSRLPVAEVESTGDTYYTLQDAIDAVTKSEEIIKLIRRYTTLNTLETTTIPEGKNIVLDLNGYTLEQNNENFLVNNGTLKITDSSEEKSGKLAAYIDKLIENNNILTLENISISAERDITNVIVNNKTIKINNSNLSSNVDPNSNSYSAPTTNFLINNGDIIVTGGNVNGSYGKYNVEMIQNIGSLELIDVNFSLSNRDNYYYSENINGIKNTGTLKISGGNYQISRAGKYAPVLIRNANKLSISGAEFNISDNVLLVNTSKENIVIDSLSPIGTGTIISNYSESGELKLTNSNVTGTMSNNGTGTLTLENITTSSSVSNNSKGILNINNVTFSSTNNYYIPITTSQAGTTNINGAIIENGYIENGYSHTININDINSVYNSTYRSGAISNTGTININGGTITSTVGNSITNTGTINIGSKDGNVSTEMPIITGKTYGVSNSDSGKVNFYDGIVSGESGAFYGTVNEVEPGYKIVTNKNDTLTSATLTLVGDDEKVAVLNGINFTSLQDAINSASDTNESIITLYKDVTFESNITVPANKNIKLYLNGYTLNKGSYDFTGEGKITVIDGTSTNALANIMESVKEVLNIEGIKKNIIIYEMDDGSAISSESTYKLYKDNEEVILEEDAIGIYSVGNSNDEIRSANNKIYINELPKGKYKLIGDNNKEVKFEIDESGKIIGNVKENTKETRKLVSTAVAELIIMIQTGIEKVNYMMIILTLLVTISSLLYIVKKTNVKES